MTTDAHHAPFESPRSLAHDLAIGLYLLCYAACDAAVEEMRRWKVVRMP